MKFITIFFLLTSLVTLWYCLSIGDLPFAVLWLFLSVWNAMMVVAYWRK